MKTRIIFSLAAAMALIMLIGSCELPTSGGDPAPADPIAVTGVVSLEGSSITVETTKSYALSFAVLPTYATDKSVAWSSDNETVASVDANGVVSGHLAGSATCSLAH